MGVGSSVDQICDMYAQAILEIRKEIPQLERRIQALQNLLAALQSRANPDQAQIIQAVKVALQNLELQQQSALAQLNAFEEEFRINCPPRPDI
jgi:chromosome segregation ATPase